MANNHFKSGSLATDDPSQIKTLWGLTIVINRWFTFEYLNSTAYTIPAGKVWHITRMFMVNPNSAGAFTVTLGYASVAVNNVAVEPAGSKYLIGSPSPTTPRQGGLYFASTPTVPIDLPLNLIVPAGNFPFLFSQSNSSGFSMNLEVVERPI